MIQHAKTRSICVGNDQKGFASKTRKRFFKTLEDRSMVVRKEEWQRLNNSLLFLEGLSLNSFKW